ncbi:MAG: hypothetical protein Q8M77_05260 [Hydrogenophaga sp.]|nr:hypothetical protein [Hydrogenophaga sp.]
MVTLYTRRDAEKILEAADFGFRGMRGPIADEHTTYRGNIVVLDERGVWPNESVDVYALGWKPCWELLGDSDTPDVGSTPGLPFDFTSAQLAAFMLSGVGALVASKFGEWDQTPCLDSLMHPDVNRAREAVIGAFDAFRKAQDAVGVRMPLVLDAQVAKAAQGYKIALQAACAKLGRTTISELGHDEFYRRFDLAKAEPTVRHSLARLEDLQAKNEMALAAWRKAMVHELLKPATNEPVAIAAAPAVRTIQMGLPKNQIVNPMSAVIKMAQEKALDRDDWTSVWAALVALAKSESKPAPLLGYTEGEGVKYQADSFDEQVAWLTREALRKRIGRARDRT